MSSLHAQERNNTTAEYGWDVKLIGYDFDGRAPIEDISTALAMLESINARADIRLVDEELAKLRIKTARKAESDDDMALTLLAYSEELAEFPPDVVIDACRSWARQNKWFPTCMELREMCQHRVKKRRMMLDALRNVSRETAHG